MGKSSILLKYLKCTSYISKKCIKYASDKIVYYSPYYLFIWYGFSIINTYYDHTIGEGLKIAAEIINFMMLSVTLRVIIFSFKKPMLIDFSTCFALLLWFLYYTAQDAANGGYEILEHLLYISVDLCTIAFLFNTFVEFMKETAFFKKYDKKIDTIYKFAMAFLCAVSIFIYCKCIKSY